MDNGTGWVAIAALIVSAVSFFWSGLRERASWRRESRLQLYMEIIDSVYARLDGAYFALADRRASRKEGYEDRRRTELRLHENQMKLMYRLRLLGNHSTLRCAIELHRKNHAVTDLVFSSFETPSDEEISAYQFRMRENENALEDFYATARRSFGLARLASESDSFWQYGDPLKRK